jgi:hypothetical protein
VKRLRVARIGCPWERGLQQDRLPQRVPRALVLDDDGAEDRAALVDRQARAIGVRGFMMVGSGQRDSFAAGPPPVTAGHAVVGLWRGCFLRGAMKGRFFSCAVRAAQPRTASGRDVPPAETLSEGSARRRIERGMRSRGSQ